MNELMRMSPFDVMYASTQYKTSRKNIINIKN